MASASVSDLTCAMPVVSSFGAVPSAMARPTAEHGRSDSRTLFKGTGQQQARLNRAEGKAGVASVAPVGYRSTKPAALRNEASSRKASQLERRVAAAKAASARRRATLQKRKTERTGLSTSSDTASAHAQGLLQRRSLASSELPSSGVADKSAVPLSSQSDVAETQVLLFREVAPIEEGLCEASTADSEAAVLRLEPPLTTPLTESADGALVEFSLRRRQECLVALAKASETQARLEELLLLVGRDIQRLKAELAAEGSPLPWLLVKGAGGVLVKESPSLAPSLLQPTALPPYCSALATPDTQPHQSLGSPVLHDAPSRDPEEDARPDVSSPRLSADRNNSPCSVHSSTAVGAEESLVEVLALFGPARDEDLKNLIEAPPHGPADGDSRRRHEGDAESVERPSRLRHSVFDEEKEEPAARTEAERASADLPFMRELKESSDVLLSFFNKCRRAAGPALENFREKASFESFVRPDAEELLASIQQTEFGSWVTAYIEGVAEAAINGEDFPLDQHLIEISLATADLLLHDPTNAARSIPVAAVASSLRDADSSLTGQCVIARDLLEAALSTAATLASLPSPSKTLALAPLTGAEGGERINHLLRCDLHVNALVSATLRSVSSLLVVERARTTEIPARREIHRGGGRGTPMLKFLLDTSIAACKKLAVSCGALALPRRPPLPPKAFAASSRTFAKQPIRRSLGELK